MSSYLINLSESNSKDMYLVGLLSEMAKTNNSISFGKISDNIDIFDMPPDALTDEEAELVAKTYEEEAKSDEGYSIEEAKKIVEDNIEEWRKHL